MVRKARKLAAAVGLIGLFALIFFWSRGDLAAWWRAAFVYEPCLEVPEWVDLGEKERFKIAVAPLTLKNTGKAPLIIHQILSSCGCVGLEREDNGTFYHLPNIQIPPNSEVHVVARLPVRGRVGDKEAYTFDLHSNDPERAVQRVMLVVSRIAGGLEIVPDQVQLGRLTLGKIGEQTIQLFDAPQQRRLVTRVTCTSCEKTMVEWKPAEAGAAHPLAPPKARWLGTLHYQHWAQQPGPFKHELVVTYHDQAKQQDGTEIIQVRGEVLPIAEIIPNTVMLPRRTGQGWVREVRCKVRFTLDEPGQVQILEAPPYLAVEFQAKKDTQEGFLLIRLRPESTIASVPSTREGFIKLHARCGGHQYECTMPVYLNLEGLEP